MLDFLLYCLIPNLGYICSLKCCFVKFGTFNKYNVRKPRMSVPLVRNSTCQKPKSTHTVELHWYYMGSFTPVSRV